MRVKIDWLNELVDLVGLSTEEIVNTASLYSIEIENVDTMVKASNIVIGHVLTKVPHPNSDHLNLLTVDVKSEVLNIVCGAPNVDVDQYVIVALSGAKLSGGVIKPSKIRGYESNGMVCSLQELGIESKYVPEQYAAGIYYFLDKVEVGTKGDAALQLDSPVLELGITPNRGDLLSMIGVAYEFSASFNRPLKPLVYKLERDIDEKADKMEVSIETDKCITYYAQMVTNITIKPSPRWLKARLIAFGLRPINNCVDITNYILALYGQPLHAFDLDVIGHKIVIKNSQENTKFVTLDGIERILSKNDIVITDGVTPMCLGGVMGGQESEVNSNTKNIMLEAAVFDPMTIRKTATRLNLHSEASMRYERSVDTNRTKEALNYACYLFKTLADAKIVNEPTVAGTKNIPDKLIKITVEKINSVLGVKIAKDQIIDIFRKLNFIVTEKADTLEVRVPNRRPDITIPEDLIEEVARLYGYAAMPSTLPLTSIAGGLTLEQKNRRLIEDSLLGEGINQVVTYSLVTKYDNTHFNILKKPNIEGISILMPMVEDREVLRQSLIPSLLSVEKYNVVRKNKDISDFEISNIYYYTKENNKKIKHEELHLGGVMCGEFSNSLWQGKQEKVDFYLVKGIIAKLFTRLGKQITFTKLTIESNELHPGRAASIVYKNQMIGYMGELHPQYAQDTGLFDTYVFEINLSDIIGEPNSFVKFADIPKLPAVERDIALVMQKDVQIDQVLACIKHSCKDLLTNATPFDLYIGPNVGEDEKSVAIKLIFSSSEALTDEKIKAMIKRILKDLKYKMNITLREM